jgi:threonine synthase
MIKLWKGLIETYREYLPVNESTPVITLNEGNTPLIRAKGLEKILKGLEIYFKYEGLNPTGSFKDRGMTMAVSKAVEEGSKAVMCASTGNTSASAAAYAARAGLKCIVLIPNKNIALGKLAQAITYGAEVIAVDGNFDDALKLVREITSKYPITLVNSINPFRIEGQKTAAFEICDQLGDSPDFLAIPVGNAGNITAYWKGFKEYHDRGKNTRLPVLLGFQAAGAAPLVENRVIERPETIATAIRIGNPASWKTATAALKESGGEVGKVTDEEILEAYKLLASKEGIFVEPASASSLAGVIKMYNKGFFIKSQRIVCVLTGHGLKDPDISIKIGKKPELIPVDIGVLEEKIL